MDELLGNYLSGLRSELSSGERNVHVFEGVRELLDELEREPTVTLGLLTGNIEEGAHAKLGAAGSESRRRMQSAL